MIEKNLNYSSWNYLYGRIREHRVAFISLWVVIVLILFSLIIPFLSSYDVYSSDVNKIFLPFSYSHILGTDEYGRDVFTTLWAGGRVSLAVGIFTILFSALIGVIVGACAGYWGGVVDSLLMRFTDIMMSVPVFPVLIILSSLDYKNKFDFGFVDFAFLGETEIGRFLLIVFVITLFSWMNIARLVRAEVIYLKETAFVRSIEILGASRARILMRHIIPNSMNVVIVSSTLSFGSVIQYEAVLSFLGLGLSPTTPSWGNMLSNSIEYITRSGGLFIYPGILITLTVLSVNLIGDAFRDILNPRENYNGDK